MDPYLEAPDVWPAFHHQMVASVLNILRPGLVDRYQARIVKRCYTTSQEVREESIEFHEVGGKLVTLLELVSPENKTTAAGRAAYLQTRQQAKDAGANIAEIDVVLQGRPMLDYSRDGLPKWDYAVTVTRASQPERYEIYTATINKRLPRFRLPLAADDRDTVLDLQAAFSQAYEEGNLAARIDHQSEPTTSMTRETLDEIRALLKLPGHDDIALAAYFIWMEQGCPHGRSDEHWRLAIERVKKLRGPL